MQWYEEIMDTAREAVDYIGSTLSTDGSMEEPTRQVLILLRRWAASRSAYPRRRGRSWKSAVAMR